MIVKDLGIGSHSASVLAVLTVQRHAASVPEFGNATAASGTDSKS
jgi:hypothetical protein